MKIFRLKKENGRQRLPQVLVAQNMLQNIGKQRVGVAQMRQLLSVILIIPKQKFHNSCQASSFGSHKTLPSVGLSGNRAIGNDNKNCSNRAYTAFGPVCQEMMVAPQFQCLGRCDMPTPLEQDLSNAKKIKP